MVQVTVEMSKKEMRKLIIDDVLKQFRHRKLQANSRYYFYPKTGYTNSNIFDESTEQIQNKVSKIQKNCTVCALGACFLSYVKKFNNCTFQDIAMRPNGSMNPWDRDKFLNILNNAFENKQLQLIERAFEYSLYDRDNYFSSLTEKEKESAVEFGSQYKSDRQRLIAIMENIVANDYTFKPVLS